MKRSSGDGLTVRPFESALQSVDNLVSAINMRLDQSVDEFNGVVEQIEQYQETMNANYLEVVGICNAEMSPFGELAGLMKARYEDLQIHTQHAGNRTNA